MIDLNNTKRIYFVGIGGIAMSAVANIAKILGYVVTGSDNKGVYDPAKSILDKAKINYHLGYDQKNIKLTKADLYIFSAGEGMENPEVKYIIEHDFPHVGFPQLLYELAKDKLKIVVAGTHGKSTIAGLLGHLLKNIDDSSFMVGAVLLNYNSNFHKGDGHYFVFEGDEYKSEFDDPTPKFHYYKPDILVLNNLEYDHPDIFSSFNVLVREFEQLISNMPEDGLIVYNADDANLTKLLHQTNITSCGFSIDNPSDFQVSDVKFLNDYTEFEVHNTYSENLLDKTENYKIQLPGRMNVYNALAAVTTLRVLGFSYEQIALDLLSFKGLKRRFEVVGKRKGVTIIDDYAHHPTAVRETLEAARVKYPKARIWAIFEPHTFSRTKTTLPDLANSFDLADQVLISEIYPARESVKDATISSTEVIEAIKMHNKRSRIRNIVRLVKNKSEALDLLKIETEPGDAVIIMAVGDFNKLAYGLKDIL